MSKTQIDDIESVVLEEIQKADMVLVGIGEEFDGEVLLRKNEVYQAVCKSLEDAEKPWVIPALNQFFIKEMSGQDGKCRQLQALEKLGELLQGKNFFLLSVATNDLIWESGIRQDRIVAPCGGSLKKQCGNHAPVLLTEEDKRRITVCRQTGRWAELELEACEACGSPMVLNNVYTGQYDERGYLDRWQLYTKWLQGSMNRKVCILELGVGLQCPSVIRFPFEKIAYFNQKSAFIRVNGIFSQLPEGLNERGFSLQENAVDFLLGLSKAHYCDKL